MKAFIESLRVKVLLIVVIIVIVTVVCESVYRIVVTVAAYQMLPIVIE